MRTGISARARRACSCARCTPTFSAARTSGAPTRRRSRWTRRRTTWSGSAEHLKSPLRVGGPPSSRVRRRLADPDCPIDFPVLADLRAQGMTDFLVVPLRFITGEIHAASFTTRRPGGFTRRRSPRSTAAAAPYPHDRDRGLCARRATSSTPTSAARRREGARRPHQRGEGEEIRAVIWFCDLRDSTPLAESMTAREVPGAAERLLRNGARAGGGARRRDPALHRRRGARHLPARRRPAAVACAQALERRGNRSPDEKLNAEGRGAAAALRHRAAPGPCSTATSARRRASSSL